MACWRGARRIVAGGGDGTINAVAARLLDRDATLGVLPLGTLNHFARDLGIPFDLEEAPRDHCRRPSGHRPTSAKSTTASSSTTPASACTRASSPSAKTRRHRLGIGKWPALVRATWHALRDPSSFNAVVCVDGETLQRRTPFIFVGNNRYVLKASALGTPPRLDEGLLSLYVLRPKTPFGLLWLGLRALLGIGSHADDFEAFEADEFRSRSPTRVDRGGDRRRSDR